MGFVSQATVFLSLLAASAGPVSMESLFRSQEGKDLPARMSEATGVTGCVTRCGWQGPVASRGTEAVPTQPGRGGPRARALPGDPARCCDAVTGTGRGRPRDPRRGGGWKLRPSRAPCRTHSDGEPLGRGPDGHPRAGHRENAQRESGSPSGAATAP